uniref:Si:ch211-207k7.4 n=1 Tax=Cyprinus carpio TaxID=7962 RepID=A0A8C2DCF9_CYPCA
MITLYRLRFLLTSHGFKYASKFISNGQLLNLVLLPCFASGKAVSSYRKDIHGVSHRKAVKVHLTLNSFSTVTVNRLCWKCGSSKEQEYSEEQSALVNKAYRTLQKPLSRAVYMLELRGVLLEEGTDATADPAFLLEIMEINESLAETCSQDEVKKLKDLTERMNSSLNKGDLLTAKELLAQMKYFTNIEEKVKDRIAEEKL